MTLIGWFIEIISIADYWHSIHIHMVDRVMPQEINSMHILYWVSIYDDHNLTSHFSQHMPGDVRRDTDS